MRWFNITVIAVLAIGIVIFALQNFQSATVDLLGLSLTAPLAVLFVVIYILGMVTGSSVRAVVRWAWQESRQTKTR